MALNQDTLAVVMGILVFVVCIYLFLEQQVDESMHRRRAKGPADGKKRTFLQNIMKASFDDQLIEALLMINSALKAGRNLDQAFELVAVSTPSPMCDEFQKLVQERRLGVSMVEALGNLSRRVNSPDLRLAINATIFQQDTGGNLEDLYKQIVITIAERKRIMGKIVAGTAHARISGNLIGILPLVFAGLIFVWHPSYIVPLIDNPLGQLVLIASLLSSILGLIFINRMTSGIMPDPEDQMAIANDPKKKAGRWSIVKAMVRPLAGMNEALGGSLFNRMRDELRYLLGAAGNPGELSVNEFMSFQEIVSVLLTVTVLLLFNPLKFGALGFVLLIVLLPIGFYLPKMYLTQLIRKRQQNIEYELPYAIDLLSLSIEAGLDLIGGMQKIVEKSRPTDIVIEFQMFLADIKYGKSLEEALTEMADRVQVLSFFAFVSSLIQAQRLGAEIGPTLRAQAEQMRYQRMLLAEERVNQLPVKLLIPLVIFVFPSIFVWLIGPSLIYMLRSFPAVLGH